MKFEKARDVLIDETHLWIDSTEMTLPKIGDSRINLPMSEVLDIFSIESKMWIDSLKRIQKDFALKMKAKLLVERIREG